MEILKDPETNKISKVFQVPLLSHSFNNGCFMSQDFIKLKKGPVDWLHPQIFDWHSDLHAESTYCFWLIIGHWFNSNRVFAECSLWSPFFTYFIFASHSISKCQPTPFDFISSLFVWQDPQDPTEDSEPLMSLASLNLLPKVSNTLRPWHLMSTCLSNTFYTQNSYKRHY